jgi:hypothetical protein
MRRNIIKTTIKNNLKIKNKNFGFFSQKICKFSEKYSYPQCFSNILKKPFSSLDDKKSCLNFILSRETEKKNLKTSLIRELDIGKNYFSQINPRRKKLLTTLLNSYVNALNKTNEIKDFVIALDLYFKNLSNGKKFADLEDKELDFSEETLMHLNNLFSFDRYSTTYCRYEYMDYQIIIERFNKIEKNKANKAKYIFTMHPNIPNSPEQILMFYEINKAIEENDLEYLDDCMINYLDVCKKRKFEKPNIFDEYYASVSNCLPNMIKAIGMAYEYGFERLSNFYELPGFYIEYCHKEKNTIENSDLYDFDLGYLSYAHLSNIRICINIYKDIIFEAKISENFSIKKLLEYTDILENYCDNIQDLLEKLKSNDINKLDFLKDFPSLNITQIEENLFNLLETISKEKSSDNKLNSVGKKILEIFKIFQIKGTTFQLVFPPDAFTIINNPEENIYQNIIEEAKLINNNGNFVDMIIKNFQNISEYQDLKNYFENINLKGNVQIVPRIDNFSSYNDTDSKITYIASSQSRKNDGLLLTELRLLRESKNYPEKTILLGQGTTCERGGGPYKLLHMKYRSLTKEMRERHLRTVQGFYLVSEFLSKDLAFTFLLNGSNNINTGEHFNPSNDYMDFLFELDSVVGIPQRLMSNSKEWNDIFVKNPKIKSLVDLYNYSGSKVNTKPMEYIKKEKSVVQAYILSDRCSNLHPELAYWDRVTEELQKKIIFYYYNNNRHFKYVLSVYAFMIKRFDIELAIQELGLDSENEYIKQLIKGKNALEVILNKLGLGKKSTPVISMYSQHLGLVDGSKLEEVDNKEKSFKMMYKLQNYQVNKYLKEMNIGLLEDSKITERKIKIIQSGLSNVSQFNGKG